MKAADVNDCMNVLEGFAEEARGFASNIFAKEPVTKSGPWCEAPWWRETASKYLKSGTLACGGAALAACAEFKARDTGIDPEIYLRLWIAQTDSPYRPSIMAWLGGISVAPSTIHTLTLSVDEVFDAIDSEKFGVSDCLYMLDHGVQGQLANRAEERIAEIAPEIVPLAQYMIKVAAIKQGKLAERWR